MINYLLFADENLIFCEANKEASQQLLDLLKHYALASRQCINVEKTTIVFSRNVQTSVKVVIMAFWGCRGTTQYGKYLSLPPMVGR